MFEKSQIKLEQEPVKTENEIKHERVAELELPIKIIIEKIRSRIENGEYGLIIGDDASGRIPALILGNFMKEIYSQKGYVKPNIIFIPGKMDTISVTKEELGDYIEEWGTTKDKRVLIVTDTVLTGGSLEALVWLLKKGGYVCDIATIGIERPIKHFINRKINLGSTKIISGQYDSDDIRGKGRYKHIPRIYGSQLSGVRKESGQYRSKVLKNEDVYIEKIKHQIQDNVNTARDDVKTIVNRLVDWYLKLNEK